MVVVYRAFYGSLVEQEVEHRTMWAARAHAWWLGRKGARDIRIEARHLPDART